MRRPLHPLMVGAFSAIALATGQATQEIDRQVRTLYEHGEWAEAARLATQPDGHSADLDLYRGLALARLGKLDAAEQAFLDGQRTHPADPRFALELAGVAYRRQDIGTAKRRLMEALHLDPSNSYGNDFLASLFLLDGNLPGALKYWNRIYKPLVQNLRFEPALSLRPVLRERAFAISAGQVFTLDRLQTTEANLDRLGVLASYQFDLAPRDDQRFDLTFRSFEGTSFAGGWLGRILPLARGLPYQTLDLDLYNLGQRAINLNALGRWDPDKRRIAMDISGPVRLNPRLKYRLAADARDENWDLRSTYFGKPGGLDGLLLRKIEAGGELIFGVNGKLQWTPALWVARRSFDNGGESHVFADSWSFELRNALTYRLWTWPERRVRVESAAVLRTGRVLTGAPSRFVITQGALSGIWLPQSKGDDLTVAARIRSGKGFGALPFDEFFMLGMERDNDLWLRGHVGTRDGRKGNAPLGTQYSLFQTEVERTVFKFPLVRFQIGPFFDAGRIGDPSGLFGSRGWMKDTGLEARIKTLGNVTWRIVYGRDLRDGRGVFYTAVSR